MRLLDRFFGKTDKNVERNGVPAKATIVSVKEGPPIVNGRPTFTIDLEVHLPEGPARAEARQRVSSILLGRLLPGSAVPVRLDPKDRTHAVLDQHAMLGQADNPK
ncbi:MAG: hypothetical protein ACKVVT_08325 [Dehalococcoidia bacterium]